MPTEFTLNLDYEAYQNFVIFSLFRNKAYRYAKQIYFGQLVLIPIAVVLFFLPLPDIIPVILLSLSVFTFIVFGLGMFILPKFRFKKLDPVYKLPQNFTFCDNGFFVSFGNADSDYKKDVSYDYIHYVYEAHDAIYVFTADDEAYPIPKKFMDEEQIKLITAKLQESVKQLRYKICYKK